MLYFVKTPKIIKRLFNNLTWSINTNEKVIYLTFDDGPTPKITQWVLNELKKYNAQATFFCIGKNAVSHPDILSQTASQKHTIGNHSQNHLNCWKVSSKTYLEDLEQAQNSINQQLKSNHKSNLFRPPYGKITPKVAKKIIKKGYKIIMWDVLSADFDQKISSKKCLENILKNTTKGSIIVFHDSIKAEQKLKYVLPKVLKHYNKQGFSFKSLH